MSNSPVLELDSLTIDLVGDDGQPLRIIDDISIEVGAREIVAVVGESGSGKSVTARAVLGLLGPSGRIVGGEVRFHGERIDDLTAAEQRAFRGKRISMVSQDAMSALDPLMRVGDQIAELIMLHEDVGRAEARARAVELLRLTGIPEPEQKARLYPFQFSGGMVQRAVIAMALSCNPDVLIADEPTTALDVTIVRQVVDLLVNLRDRLGIAIVFITHDLGLVAGLADRAYVMYAGRIVETGTAAEVLTAATHPYSKGLLRAMPRLDADRHQPLYSIPGQPPSPVNRPAGCPFHPRCAVAVERCSLEMPPLTPTAEDAACACWVEAPPAGGRPTNGGVRR